jgi:nicotinamidase-related amidase
MTTITSNYTKVRFSKDDSALLMIDHQSGIMQLNHDPTRVEFRSAAIALAKVGKIFNLPTIITSSYETGPNGPSSKSCSISTRTRRSSGVPARSALGTVKSLWRR